VGRDQHSLDLVDRDEPEIGGGEDRLDLIDHGPQRGERADDEGAVAPLLRATLVWAASAVHCLPLCFHLAHDG